MLVEVATTEEGIGVHLTCQINDAHERVPKRLSPLPGCRARCAGPSEWGIQMEIREVNNFHEQQLELAMHGSHIRVTPDIVGASVSEVESDTRKDSLFATSHKRHPSGPLELCPSVWNPRFLALRGRAVGVLLNLPREIIVVEQ